MDEVGARRTYGYTVTIRRDLRPRPWSVVWRPYSATITAGVGILGERACRARTRTGLQRKCRRIITRDVLARGRTRATIAWCDDLAIL